MTRRNWLRNNIDYSPLSVIVNIFMVYVCYMICRVEFVIENWAIFRDNLDAPLALSIVRGGLRFDTSAIIYTNLLYFLLVLLPVHYKETPVMRTVTKWVFIIPNALAILVNFMDSVYFPYTFRRTTTQVFKEFGGNTNIGSIVGIEFVNHWYLVLLFAAMVYGLWRLYRPSLGVRAGETLKRYYIRQSVILVLVAPWLVMGMRGNTFFHVNRPISASEANEYVNEPAQAGIVLNTPFSLIRLTSRHLVNIPEFYTSTEEMEAVFTPVHIPSDSATVRQKNICIILLESMSEEFIGAMRRPEAGDDFKSLTPFIDSLYRESLTFEQSFANGWISLDGIPLVQSSLPKLFNPYVVSPYALNDTPGLAKELKDKGYSAAYFHGAENSSLGLKASARSTGIMEYYGLDEYMDDPRTGGKADYDGTWGIFDEKFLQYFCTKMGEMPQPFLATCFTLTSHHPFPIPEEYKDVFPETDPDYPVKKCISYTDYSLRRFFESARKQPWYDNTIFVITADHTYRVITREAYRNYAGYFRIPIMFFDPSGEMPRGERQGISQQIDIMPTLLGYLGYDKPYTAFGVDLLNTPAEDTWAFIYQDYPQYFKGDYMIGLKDWKLAEVYRFRTDFTLKDNLYESGDYDKEYVEQMVRELQAILQTADTRMKTNTLRATD